MLGPLQWSMPKITKSDAKLSEIYEQNEWHLFSRQCNLLFLSTKVLQGSVATCVNYDRIFIDSFTANLLQSVMVKEFWKSVTISQSYRQNNKVAPSTRCIFDLHFTNLHVYLESTRNKVSEFCVRPLRLPRTRFELVLYVLALRIESLLILLHICM